MAVTALGRAPLINRRRFQFSVLYFRKDIEVRTKSAALYGQLNYHFTDKLTAFLGGRYTFDNKRRPRQRTT
ncbi:hypothetical protein [Sphingomonas sp. RB1R13]|uniref:hypothetical protein n=1 Tax=Sphingomonas sp. RB1R13 TaxID=3096159 RepID=UPI002FC5D4B4